MNSSYVEKLHKEVGVIGLDEASFDFPIEEAVSAKTGHMLKAFRRRGAHIKNLGNGIRIITYLIIGKAHNMNVNEVLLNRGDTVVFAFGDVSETQAKASVREIGEKLGDVNIVTLIGCSNIAVLRSFRPNAQAEPPLKKYGAGTDGL